MTETIEQAAERFSKEGSWQCPESFKAGWNARDSQPNPHHIYITQVIKLEDLYNSRKITRFRMVEILNEIAAGKHKERIEI